MIKPNQILNFLIYYFIVSSGFAVYAFLYLKNNFSQSITIIIVSIVACAMAVTYSLGNKYKVLKKKELDKLRKKYHNKNVDPAEDIKPAVTWGEVLNNAKSKRLR